MYEWAPKLGRRRGLLGDAETRWERERPYWPGAETVRNRFGSWRAALHAAGLGDPAQRPVGSVAERVRAAHSLRAQGWNREAIAAELGVTAGVVTTYFRATNCPGCGDPVIRGETCELCHPGRAAGREVFYTERPDRDAILRLLVEWTQERGTPPSWPQWQQSSPVWRAEFPRWPAAWWVARTFGTWNAALEAAGLPVALAPTCRCGCRGVRSVHTAA